MNQSSNSNPESELVEMHAEMATLGSIALDGTKLDEVAQILKPEDFRSLNSQTMYRTMLSMQADGDPVDDTVLLSNRLKKDGNLNQQSFYHLMNAIETVAHAENACYYAKEVREKSLRYRLQVAASDALSKSRNVTQNIQEVISQTEESIHSLLEDYSGEGAIPLSQSLTEMFDTLNADEKPGLKTGWPDLDKLLNGGLQPGSFYLLAARPSMGKTAAVLNLLTAVAKAGHAGLFFSLEQSRQEVTERIISAKSGVSAEKIKSGNLSEIERNQLTEHSNPLAELKIHIDDASQKTVSQIAAAARLHKRRHGLAVVVVDYIQLLQAADSKQPREQQVSTMSRSLKCLARDLSVPVIALAQLNRTLESRTDKRPQLSDLRESGSLEQDADVVLFLHREAVYSESADPSDARLIVRKNRNGRRGEVRLHWNGPCMSFHSASNQTEQQYF